MLLMEVRLRVLGAGYRRCRCCPKALPGALAANLASRREVGWEVGWEGGGGVAFERGVHHATYVGIATHNPRISLKVGWEGEGGVARESETHHAHT